MKQVSISELVFDFDYYPRASVDTSHVKHLAEAILAGAELPPIIVDSKSKRIVDGFHRARAHLRVSGEDATIAAIFKTYKDEAAMFVDAMRYNGAHGRNLSTYDRAHCIILAERLKIEPDQIAASLAITVERVGELKRDRVGELRSNGGIATPLKRTIRHMAGRSLSVSQGEAQDKLGGMDQLFYVNQLVVLIENDLLDRDNEQLMLRLNYLADLISKVREKAAA